MKGTSFCFLFLAFFSIQSQAQQSANQHAKPHVSGKSVLASVADETETANIWIKRTIERNQKLGLK